MHSPHPLALRRCAHLRARCATHTALLADACWTAQPAAATPALQRTHAALRELAAQTGEAPGALLYITFANDAVQDMLVNWVVHARRAGVHAFLVGAMDARMQRFCSQQGLLSWPMDDEGLLDLVAASNGTGLTRLADGNFRCAHACNARRGATSNGLLPS